MLDQHMQSCDFHNGNDCNCDDWSVDMEMMGPMPTLSAEEAAKAKADRKRQSEGARIAYLSEMGRSGNKEYAKLAARYGAHGAALECIDSETRRPSFNTIGNGSDPNNSRGRAYSYDRKAAIAGVACEYYEHPHGGQIHEYIVPQLYAGTAFVNRRPGARNGWVIGFTNEEDCERAEFVRVKEIDGSSCHVFRVHRTIEDKPVTRYFAVTRHMSRKRIAPTGKCSDTTPAWVLCQHNANHRTPQIVRVFVAAERCV